MIQEASPYLPLRTERASISPVPVTSEVVRVALEKIMLIPDEFFFEPLNLKTRYEVLRARLSLLPHVSLLNLFHRKVVNNEAILNQPKFKKDSVFAMMGSMQKLNFLAERLASKPRNELIMCLELLETLTLQAKL